MEKEFISYEQALALKELGFNEPCLAVWWETSDGLAYIYIQYAEITIGTFAPLYQQAFRWFIEKYNLYGAFSTGGDFNKFFWQIWEHDITNNTHIMSSDFIFETYKEAEEACLTKLIEIVKNNMI